jgi:hypothetical protein
MVCGGVLAARALRIPVYHAHGISEQVQLIACGVNQAGVMRWELKLGAGSNNLCRGACGQSLAHVQFACLQVHSPVVVPLQQTSKQNLTMSNIESQPI